jgi:hypothetical protein
MSMETSRATGSSCCFPDLGLTSELLLEAWPSVGALSHECLPNLESYFFFFFRVRVLPF